MTDIVSAMTDTAEDLVRRATAAFNAGRRDEAKQLCEQGLARAPNEPMLSHLLAAVLFSASENSAARRHIEASARRTILMPRFRISTAPSRSRHSAMRSWRRPARWIRQG
jgi:predicted Zn-dependent protease